MAAFLKKKCEREAAGKISVFYANGRPIDVEKVVRYCQRNKISSTGLSEFLHSQSDPERQIVCRTPPPAERPLQMPERLAVPELILHSLDKFIRGSLESGLWESVDDESYIMCRSSSQAEIQSLDVFEKSTAIGIRATEVGDHKAAGDEWRIAFLELESLLKGTNSGIIPKILKAVNGLLRWHLTDVATMMIRQIAQLSVEFQRSNSAISMVLLYINRASLEIIQELEYQVRVMFHKLFERYLGSHCYSTLIAMAGKARSKLLCNPDETVEQHFPTIASLDREYGPLDRRTLMVQKARLDVLTSRGDYLKLMDEALHLNQRASELHDSQWQHYFYLVLGYFGAGFAQYGMGDEKSAKQSLSYALHHEQEFCRIYDSDYFRSERFEMEIKLHFLIREFGN